MSDFLHYLFSTWLNPFAHKFCQVWTSQVLHFGVEATNRAESQHSVLKLWLSTCHGDLDTVFLNIDSLIQAQIAEIKYTLEISKLKEKYGAKSNVILKNLSNKVSHLVLKKIMDELKKAREMVEEPGSNCLHYLRKSHSLSCACELVHRFQYLIPIREEDVDIFWKKLEIGSDILEEHDRDMDSEKRDLTSLIHEISMGPISKVREVKCLIKGSRSGSGSGSGSGPSSHGRGRPPRSGKGRGRGRNVTVVGSTTVLPLVSNMDGNAGKIFIGIIEEQQHFIQVFITVIYFKLLSSRVASRAIKSNRAWGGITGATGTSPYNHPCRNSVEWPEHWSMSLSISAKVPQAILPPQKYSSTHTSYCLVACVPPEAG
ncbi:hypothetical protein M9H77_33580 [Catharanthus roseus]|uniref:Uncharacterized protein n=1 Tax=Catharanthus roseus TaxID=4058 RepID=A0ACB9ZMB0_CATRO|nr:hypothetical protein M9H77_33580 [Catharanthus roseus]